MILLRDKLRGRPARALPGMAARYVARLALRSLDHALDTKPERRAAHLDGSLARLRYALLLCAVNPGADFKSLLRSYRGSTGENIQARETRGQILNNAGRSKE